jgi:hypothetical protein
MSLPLHKFAWSPRNCYISQQIKSVQMQTWPLLGRVRDNFLDSSSFVIKIKPSEERHESPDRHDYIISLFPYTVRIVN